MSSAGSTCSACGKEYSIQVKLMCHHIYCFECIKVLLIRNIDQCPDNSCGRKICQSLKRRLLLAPHFSHATQVDEKSISHRPVLWLYAGGRSNTWWIYDLSHMNEIEQQYQEYHAGRLATGIHKLTIYGHSRTINFDSMLQINDDQKTIRKIIRVVTDQLDDFKKKNQILGLGGHKMHI